MGLFDYYSLNNFQYYFISKHNITDTWEMGQNVTI